MAQPKATKDKGLHERIVFLAESDLAEWLQRQSEATGAPMGHIIRKAIESYRQTLKKR
jgi:hypothetical protein